MFAGDTLQRDDCLRYLAGRISGLHVGAKTALGWHGIVHNIPAREVMGIWGPRDTRLPGWFSERFPARYTVRKLFVEALAVEEGLAPLAGRREEPVVSVPERALLEMLSEVGVRQELDEARHIMEGARALRPEVLDVFLTGCLQEKAARLCVGWSRELGLPWAGAARKAVGDRFGTSRWVKQLKDGRTLILKP